MRLRVLQYWFAPRLRVPLRGLATDTTSQSSGWRRLGKQSVASPRRGTRSRGANQYCRKRRRIRWLSDDQCVGWISVSVSGLRINCEPRWPQPNRSVRHQSCIVFKAGGTYAGARSSLRCTLDVLTKRIPGRSAIDLALLN